MPVKKTLPFKPKPNATILELMACMGDLLIWALEERLEQLMAAGLTDKELMLLRRAAVNHQKGTTGFQDARLIMELMPLFEQVHITKPDK